MHMFCVLFDTKATEHACIRAHENNDNKINTALLLPISFFKTSVQGRSLTTKVMIEMMIMMITMMPPIGWLIYWLVAWPKYFMGFHKQQASDYSRLVLFISHTDSIARARFVLDGRRHIKCIFAETHV